MPSTHLSLHYHLVFSTKDRVPIVTSAWREHLHAYLGGIVKKIDGIPEAIGGTNDHVHLLIGLRATHCLADVVRDIKAASSRWVHEEIGEHSATWQDGYGAFTVGAPQCEDVCDYISRQEEHHRKQTFQEEYLDFLRRGAVEYDERYLW
jgi:REP element-mobilizing transposase RayT